ncbi:MAG: thioredoxin family protein [Campylobacterota bacterium]|nr:thioredoxin family protein [Campylobacterota bacterium]
METKDVNQEIKNNDAIMIYFSGENCGVCKALQPKIQKEFTNNFPKIKQLFISASDFPQIAVSFSVFTIPSVVVFFEGKENLRKSRHISVLQLSDELKRPYGLLFDN